MVGTPNHNTCTSCMVGTPNHNTCTSTCPNALRVNGDGGYAAIEITDVWQQGWLHHVTRTEAGPELHRA